MAQLIARADIQEEDLVWLQTIWRNPVERLFWINDVPLNTTRGEHRHPSCHMALTCLVGSVNVYVQTPQEDQYYTLNDPSQYLLLEPEDWRSMYSFSADALLFVLAEKPYASTEYVDEPYRSIIR